MLLACLLACLLSSAHVAPVVPRVRDDDVLEVAEGEDDACVLAPGAAEIEQPRSGDSAPHEREARVLFDRIPL